MARKKVTLAYIPNDATRRATMKKRCRGLLKKAGELSVLCGVPVCAVVYAPQAERPEVFPSAEEAGRIFAELGEMPETEKSRKMVDQAGFLEQRLLKLGQQVRRLEHDNRELATAVRLRQCLAGLLPAETLGKEDADALLEMIDRRSKAVQTRLHQLGVPPAPFALPAPPLPVSPATAEKLGFEAAAVEAMRQYDWIGCGGGGGGGGAMASGMVEFGHGPVVAGAEGGGGAADDVLALLMEHEYRF